jgi:hypothetical protein
LNEILIDATNIDNGATQCNLAASDDPIGPSAEDVKKWA